MSRGYLKNWRQEDEFDLSMSDVQYKVWRLLQIRALHSPYGNLRAGDLRISYSDIQNRLLRSDGTTISDKVIKQAMDALVGIGYIQRVIEPGKPMLIRIVDWSKMQGEHPKGYEYTRPGHELPPSVSDDPFALQQDSTSPREVQRFHGGSVQGSTGPH